MRARATLSLLLCAVVLAAASAGVRAAEDPWSKNVNVELNGMPLRDAVGNLLKATGIRYSVEPDAADLKNRQVVPQGHGPACGA